MEETKNTVISVNNVSKTFKLPHEKQSSIKSALIAMAKGHKKGFEKQRALKGVSFEIEEGDFFGIVGRNGSGKSTLLKVLAGIYPPNEGEVHVVGKLIPFIELGVGFSPELSGRDNVFLNGALLGFSRREMAVMYDDIVRFAELKRFMDQKLKNYSSGMQVRLAFSIAIRARGDILLLDEVLAVGDAAFQQKCFDYFEELKQQKKTVVFVTHDMSAVNRFCNKAIYIKDGLITHNGTPEEVADLYIEENVENMEQQAKEQAQVDAKKDPMAELNNNDYKISTEIVSQTDKELLLNVKYKTNEKKPMYIAFSITSSGTSIAELTTPLDLKLTGSGEVTYTLDISRFNAGIYEIPVILCLQENRRLVRINKSKNRFVIKGNDPIRGSALKLEDTWKVINQSSK